ncbi:MAG: PIG-L family deacetylase [Phycisphaerae bacterium]|nr:PIG-L family deacetylase [Phycisphaerae bacterium]MDW8263322.1 PIG-L family deacetylase [Phycisphaerales bacterium]
MLCLCDPSRVRRLLCLGAHCDDIEIGAGGTILRLVEANPQLEIRWMVFGAADELRRQEARAAAAMFAPRAQVELLDFRDAFMPHDGARLKECFERLKREFDPDLILTHHDDDRHQDHRLISQLTWNTWRNHVIFEYEIFKYDGDLSRPNVFAPLSESLVERKISGILQSFRSQAARHWFTADVFRGLMRLRGVECNSPSGYAEAFHARKILL